MSPTRFPAGLYGVTPEWDDTPRLLAAVQAAARGGMTALQLRRKNATPAKRREQAEALARVCRERGIVFIINDHWRLAIEIGADGIHVGREDEPLASVRAQAGPALLIGASCYDDLALARQSLAAGADYIAFGAVYPSPTKPAAVHAPLALLAQGRELASLAPDSEPARLRGNARAAVVAIGGITPANSAAVFTAGADAVAVITGLFEAPDIEAAARACHPLSSE
jgi:thiamine-phosphate pyrophosphorylase